MKGGGERDDEGGAEEELVKYTARREGIRDWRIMASVASVLNIRTSSFG